MTGVTRLHQEDLRTVVFVEGVSDQLAVAAVASATVAILRPTALGSNLTEVEMTAHGFYL